VDQRNTVPLNKSGTCHDDANIANCGNFILNVSFLPRRAVELAEKGSQRVIDSQIHPLATPLLLVLMSTPIRAVAGASSCGSVMPLSSANHAREIALRVRSVS
jgi:hypothetical protein